MVKGEIWSEVNDIHQVSHCTSHVISIRLKDNTRFTHPKPVFMKRELVTISDLHHPRQFPTHYRHVSLEVVRQIFACVSRLFHAVSKFTQLTLIQVSERVWIS